MKVLKIQLDLKKVKQLPDSERIFFIGLGHIYNEINALTKMLYWIANTPQSNEEEGDGKNSLLLLIMKLIAGKLFESWRFFQTKYFGTEISREFDPKLDGGSGKAMESLKQYFNKSNNISIIRNKFGFHYSPDEVDKSLGNFNGEMNLYMEQKVLQNSLFYYAELLDAVALVEAIGFDVKQNNVDEALINLSDELLEVGHWFLIVSDGIMDLIIDKFGNDMRTRDPYLVDINNVLSFYEISIPWFSKVEKAD